ncbi:hypothetical protein GCM10010277_75850 [Streptomyces longisporoflavus]|uniref:hypothetical protein n=1 Tax=Streptomyces longisporoflavus TaxID=28044 RepID=UPI00167E47F7|nr:hypothetical protein [Streptomyces longisporoflavus]GGV67311.1 hypothetical protein GCM10010277_75850 [Streptomyces longisporoflavus]
MKANTVGRYQVGFRTYAAWAEIYEASGTEPDLAALLEAVDGRGIKGLRRLEDFRRRRRAIAPVLVDYWSSVIR